MIAFDVVLLPPEDIQYICIAQNKLATRPVEPPILLGKNDYIPHISLFMGVVDENKIGEMIERLESLTNLLPLKLEISGAENHTDSKIPHYGFKIKKTLELQQLHEKIMSLLKVYLTQTATEEMFYQNGNPKWVNGFKKKYSGPNFDPHITLWSTKVSYDKYPLKFNTSTLALCHLGRGNTCRRVLWKNIK